MYVCICRQVTDNQIRETCKVAAVALAISAHSLALQASAAAVASLHAALLKSSGAPLCLRSQLSFLLPLIPSVPFDILKPSLFSVVSASAQRVQLDILRHKLDPHGHHLFK